MSEIDSMSTAVPVREVHAADAGPGTLLVSLPVLQDEAVEIVLRTLAVAFAGTRTTIALPEQNAPAESAADQHVVYHASTSRALSSWTLAATDFVTAHELCATHNAPAVLLLGPEADSLDADSLRALAEAVTGGGQDLAVPRYGLATRSNLVTSSILYPISRALFGASPRFPLALDLGLSARAASRLAGVAQRFTAANQPDALLWPIAELAVANFSIAQVDVGDRRLPQPASGDLNSLLAEVAGSLFTDVEAKAAYWQRARLAPNVPQRTGVPPTSIPLDEVVPMLDAFRLAYGNLSEIWSLILPPNTLFGLKRLSTAPAATFSMPDALWVRIIYDFILAYRLRTINRGHLLGALTPLYLAWVSSHIIRTSQGHAGETEINALATAFELDKPYLVSRWRWPDRFNP